MSLVVQKGRIFIGNKNNRRLGRTSDFYLANYTKKLDNYKKIIYNYIN